MFNSFARLLFFDSKNRWRDTYIFGPIAIFMDRNLKAPVIKIFNPELIGKELEPIFECEIYANFSDTCLKLTTEKTHVISFIFNGRHFGFEFPLEKESRFFLSKLKAVELRIDDKKKLKEKLERQTKNLKNKDKKSGGIFSG